MADINRITITGNLTSDAVLRYTASGTPIINLRVGCNSRFTKDGDSLTDFFNVSVFGSAEHKDSAHFFSQRLKKGHKIAVTGSHISSEYIDRDGNKRTSWSISCKKSEVVLLTKADSDQLDPAVQEQQQPLPEEPSSDLGAAFQELQTDGEDLPF